MRRIGLKIPPEVEKYLLSEKTIQKFVEGIRLKNTFE